jgi:hypothetical protein
MERDELIDEVLQEFANARDEFCEAHKKGMDALMRGDYDAVLEAITAESGAIEKQKAASKRLTNDPSASGSR